MLNRTSRRKQHSPNYSTPSSTLYKPKSRTLSEEQELQIKEAFILFDPNKTNHISYHELKVILRALGFDVKKSEVVQLAREYDIEETNKISYEDYVDIMRRKYADRDPIEETLRAFKLFDENGKGKISLLDLKRVARELGETLKEEQMIAMIEEFDTDGDGMISEEEFLAIIRPSFA